MAITDSALKIFQANFDSVFKNKGTINAFLNNTPRTLEAVARRQNVNTAPLMDGAGMACVGVEVWHTVFDNTTIPVTSATPIASTCDLTTGDTLSTVKRTYNLNVFQKPTAIKASTLDCDNALKFAQKKAELLAGQLAKIAQGLNNTMIALVEANKSVPVAGNLPEGVTIALGEYTITGSTYWNGIEASKIMPILDELALIKGISGNYWILSGKALAIPKILVLDATANNNERSYEITFGRRDLVNDVRNLDPIITADVIYLIDPAAIVTYFTNSYPAQPIATGDKNNTTHYSVPLIYFDDYQSGNMNQSTLMYNSNGTMIPVRADVREQLVCVAGAYGDVAYEHIWEVGVKGLMDVVARTSTDNTGIIRVNKA